MERNRVETGEDKGGLNDPGSRNIDTFDRHFKPRLG